MRSLANLGDMTGRVALITGGAGRIGRAIAVALAEAGADLCLVDRNHEALAAVRAELHWATGKVSVCQLDLEREDEREGLVAAVDAAHGGLDVLINNAGFVGDSQLGGWVTDFREQSMETWRRAQEVNLAAPFHLAQLFAPMLERDGRGAIVNMASIYGILGPDMRLYEGTKMGNPAAYAASKGGLVQLTRWLSTTLAPRIRVNCITPGGLERGQPESFRNRYVERTPLDRMGREEDFKGVAHFLSSDLSAWVTGQNIVVDGGWSAW